MTIAEQGKQTDFFRSVDDYLRQQEDLQPTSDRRRTPRYSYPTVAMIAFCEPRQLPQINQFQSVLCRDISRGGFSFFLSISPPKDHLVVALRRDADYLPLRSRVIYCRRGEGTMEEQINIIGCEFLCRLEFADGKIR